MMSSITLKNWRSHHATEIILKRVNFFFGEPGSGKSSVPDAIVTLLIGRNRYTDARGVGIKDDITVGKPSATIVATFDNDRMTEALKVTREISAKASQRIAFENAPTNVAAAQEVLLRALHANPETVLAQMDPKNILEREEPEQVQVMLRLMRPPTIKVPEACSAVNITEINSTADIDAHIKRIKDVTIRDLNREVADLEEAIRNAPERVPDVAQARADLATVQALHKKQIEAQTLRQGYERTLSGAQRILDELKARPNPQCRPMPEILADIDSLGESEKENTKLLEEAKAFRSQAEASVRAERDAAAEDGSLADTSSGMGSECGVVKEFECPLTPRDKSRMGTLLRNRAKGHQDKMQAHQKNLDSINARIKELYTESEEIQKSLDTAEAEKRDALKAQAYESDVAEAQAELDKIVAAPVEAGDPAEVGKSQDKISELQTIIANADTAKQAVAQHSIKVAQVDGKRQAIELQQAAVAALVALKQDILKRGGDEFLSEMKAILDKFGMANVEFTPAPYSLRVSGVTARRLSSGQKLVFDAALRIAAAKATGFKLFAVDDSNRLDDPNRSAIQKMLGASGCQVIVCRTIDKPPAPEMIAKLPADCGLFWMESGSITGPTSVQVLH
jgi:hypothetical protein